MREIQRQVVIVSLVDALTKEESWSSETHLQKAVYFLQEALKVPLGLEFILYKHGPFSFELRELLGEMRASSVIDVQPRPAPYGPSLEPGAAFDALKKSYPKTLKRYSGQIVYVAKVLAPKDVGQLERLGTALYITRKYPQLSQERQARRLVELKPHVSDVEARLAIERVAKLVAEGPVASTRSRR